MDDDTTINFENVPEYSSLSTLFYFCGKASHKLLAHFSTSLCLFVKIEIELLHNYVS